VRKDAIVHGNTIRALGRELTISNVNYRGFYEILKSDIGTERIFSKKPYFTCRSGSAKFKDTLQRAGFTPWEVDSGERDEYLAMEKIIDEIPVSETSEIITVVLHPGWLLESLLTKQRQGTTIYVVGTKATNDHTTELIA
jgi:hypothetical protein